jgi:serine/threonine-protein kinase HipA
VPGEFRTYLHFARKLKAWLREDQPAALKQLWERIVFNALVANGDDHPRNHALLLEAGRWRLAPAFDIVPTYFARDRASLSMPYLRLESGRETSLVSAQYLVQAAPAFGIDAEQAHGRLLELAARTIKDWPEVLAELKAPVAAAEESRPVLEWAALIHAQAAALSAADRQPIAAKRSRRWRWAP